MRLRVGVACDVGARLDWRGACVDQLAAVPGVEIALSIEGRGRGPLELTPSQLAAFRDARLDAIVCLAGAPPPAGLADAARYGAWSLHHGDGNAYSRSPITAWAPHCARPVLDAALIATLADGRTLALQRGCLRVTLDRWPASIAVGLRSAAQWPAKVCREALDFAESPLARGVDVAFAAAPPRSGWRALRRGGARAVEGGRRFLRGTLYRLREDQWAIGIVRAPIHAFLDAPVERPVAWLPEPSRDAFLADPFALPSANGVAILAERLDRQARRGEICAVASADGHNFGPPSAVLALPTHLSYPYVFESDGVLYCIPEMHQSGATRLFEVAPHPQPWRFAATIIDGVAAIDPTILRHDGRFWLFFTTNADSNGTLHLWWATELAGPWRPHRRNPVKYDPRSSRPAGAPFAHDGQLFRPAQDCSETYGGAVRINRILRLTTDEFEEQTVAVVRPDANGPYPSGLHTLSPLGDRTLIDGKRQRWRNPLARRGFVASEPDALREALERLRTAGRGANP